MIKTRVLLIDDEVAFVEAMEKRLSHRDLNMAVAYSGLDGIKKLDEAPDIDVVLLDVKMPGMDGIETLRAIKKSHPLVEVIMLTGHATVESAVEGMKLGALDYIMKPAEIDQILAKIEEATTRRRQHLAKILEATGKELRGQRAR